jgi:hypothetical protein
MTTNEASAIGQGTRTRRSTEMHVHPESEKWVRERLVSPDGQRALDALARTIAQAAVDEMLPDACGALSEPRLYFFRIDPNNGVLRDPDALGKCSPGLQSIDHARIAGARRHGAALSASGTSVKWDSARAASRW